MTVHLVREKVVGSACDSALVREKVVGSACDSAFGE